MEAKEARIKELKEKRKKIIEKYVCSNVHTKRMVDAYYEELNDAALGLKALYPEVDLGQISFPSYIQQFRDDSEANRACESSASDVSPGETNKEEDKDEVE